MIVHVLRQDVGRVADLGTDRGGGIPSPLADRTERSHMTLVDVLEVLRTDAGVADRSPRGAVRVTGRDAVSFLQALLSADLDTVADGEGAHSLLLSPQGKLDV